MSVLALDFDGVLWDSVGECYQIARRAHENLFGPLPEGLEGPFRRARWLARTGGDFLVVLRSPVSSKAEFAARKREWAADLPPFEEEFYRLRREIRDARPDLWLSWQHPYDDMVEALPRWQARVEHLAIATTKDEGSVERLLETVGLRLPVLGRDFGTDKAAQIRRLAREHRVPPEGVLFLDDLLSNLDQVLPTGARVALAAWGYNTPREQETARQRGLPVLETAAQVVDWLEEARR